MRRAGAVLGVDIGYSPTRASGAVCRLDWDEAALRWRIARFRYRPDERRAAIRDIAGDARLEAAAFDGPFRGALDEIGVYRAAERNLTRGIGALIGRPGPCHVPSGRLLNRATNEAVADVLALGRVVDATHAGAVHPRAVVEAFPNSFLGVMLPDGHGLAKGRAGKSDRYYEALAAAGRLDALAASLLPGRAPMEPFALLRDHDERAALVCALTALCVAAGAFMAVGDDDGRIVLPPASFWNAGVLAIVERTVRDAAEGAAFSTARRRPAAPS